MDFVARPLEVVEHCCGLALEQEQQAEASGSSVPARVAEAFRARLREQGPAALAGVPLLDPRTWALDKAAGKLKPNTLVRFRGMVQDMLDPQFFVGMQKHAGNGRLRCSLYSDGFTGGEDGEEGGWEAHTTMERRPLILTPIPGEAEWVVEGLLREAAGGQRPPNGSGASSSGNKRGLGEAEEMEVEVEGEAGAAASRGIKAPRMGETDAMAVVEGGNGGAAAAAAAAADPEKKGAEGPLRCLSYLYGEKEEEEGEGEGEQSAASAAATPRLNEALDVLAVLSYTVPGATPQQQQVQGQGEGAGAGNGGMGEQDEEEAAMEQLMLSLEPRLHIVLWAKAAPLPLASFHDPAPFLGPAAAVDANAHADLEPTKARAALLAHLAASLGGDELAAEYLLLALLARVRLRSPGSGDVVGPLPVNLSRAPQGLGPRLAALLGALCPRSRLLPVDLATLDDPRAFIPRKDPARLNVLEATPLQVAPGTALVLDETGLDSGRLGPEGVANLRCLKGLVDRQAIPCHFGFYQLDFETDCPVLVVSRSRSILGGGALCQVPFTPAAASDAQDGEAASSAAAAASGAAAAAAAVGVDAETLAGFRRYLAWARQQEVEIDACIAERAEREFVGLRATEEGKKALTPEALGRWLTLCRLLCASEGAVGAAGGKVGESHWERMRALEEERMARLRALGLDPPAQ